MLLVSATFWTTHRKSRSFGEIANLAFVRSTRSSWPTGCRDESAWGISPRASEPPSAEADAASGLGNRWRGEITGFARQDFVVLMCLLFAPLWEHMRGSWYWR